MSSNEKTVTNALVGKIKLDVPRIIPIIMFVFILFTSIFHLYTGAFGSLSPYPQRLITLSTFMILGFMFYPLGRKKWYEKLTWHFVLDVLCILIIIAGTIYVMNDWRDFSSLRMAASTPMDRVVSTAFILLLMELSRRCLGIPILLISIFFVLQILFSDYLFGWFYGKPISWKVASEILFMMPEAGIFGQPLTIASRYLVTFMLFTGFLIVTNAHKSFIRLAIALTGRSRGGPAKGTIIASALVGTVQGAPSACAAAVGSFSIPMMKGLKYDPTYAASLTAVAGTGAQLVPPIMGSTAFLIASFLGLPYWQICLYALIPTTLYYTSLFSSVEFYSRRNGHESLPESERPKIVESLKNAWYLLLPIVLILIMLVRGFGLGTIGVSAVISICIATCVKKETRLTINKLLASLETGINSALITVLACSSVGIIIGSFYVSGLGQRMSEAIVQTSGGNVIIALILTCLACILLGMGMVIPAIYATMVYLAIPALVTLGCHPVAAHMFVFMCCIVAAYTPPVGLALYVTAGLSNKNVMSVGWRAVKIGFSLFIIPFFFAINPALLGIGSFFEVFTTAITGLIATIIIPAAIEGWFVKEMKMFERVLFFVAGALLLTPGTTTDIIGFVLMLPILFIQKPFLSRRAGKLLINRGENDV